VPGVSGLPHDRQQRANRKLAVVPNRTVTVPVRRCTTTSYSATTRSLRMLRFDSRHKDFRPESAPELLRVEVALPTVVSWLITPTQRPAAAEPEVATELSLLVEVMSRSMWKVRRRFSGSRDWRG
jgi:hypothetical protein